MTFQESAELQALLEGVSLPASKRELVAYARSEDEEVARTLRSLPEREYRSLDEVGEALMPVQPSWPQPHAEIPHEVSDAPPGGDAYTDPRPESGRVRPDAPPDNPPQKAIEKQGKTRDRQQERQRKLR
jgi:hypothetical protein